MEEKWIELHYTHGYEISNIGHVRHKKTGRLLTNSEDPDGYIYVTMYIKPKYIRRSVHTLVANAFITNPENKPTVNHKDKNKKNNTVDNLEWATHSEQILHRIGIFAVVGLY